MKLLAKIHTDTDELRTDTDKHAAETSFSQAGLSENSEKCGRRGVRKDHAEGWLDRILTALFYLAWTAELTVVIIDKSALINPYESYIFRATFVVFLIIGLVNIDRYSTKQRIIFLFLLVISFIDYRICGQNVLLRAVVFVAACRQIVPRKALQYTLFFTMAGCLVLVMLSLAGILGTVSITQEYGHGIETRYTLGLGHPNALHCMACMLILLTLYLYGGQHSRMRRCLLHAALFILNLGLYVLTRSNSGFLTAAAGIVLSAILQAETGKQAVSSEKIGHKKIGYKIVCIAGEIVFGAGLLFSLLGAIIDPAGHPFFQKIDRLMTGRVSSLWDTTFHEGTLSTWYWFGSRENTAYFDMGFVRFVYWYGVIPAVILLVLIFLLLHKLRTEQNAAAFVMLLMCCIYTIPEAHLVSVYIGRNYCLLLAAACIPRDGQRQRIALPETN